MRDWQSHVGRYALVALLFAEIIGFSLIRPDTFGSWDNFRSIFSLQAAPVTVALAVLMPLVIGQFDLSVAGNAGLAQIIAIGLISQQGMPVGVAIVSALAASTILGLFNGLVIAFGQVSSFIATLASGSLFLGIQLWYTGGGTLFDPLPRSFTNLGRGSMGGIPLVIIYVIVIALVLWYILNYTVLGRRMYAVGSNPTGATLIGINVRGQAVAMFCVSGFLAGMTGVILATQLGTAQPGGGSSLLIPAFTGALLSAAAVQVGRYNVVGAVVGVNVIAIAVSGLQQLGAPLWVQPVFNGSALIIAVAASGWLLRRREHKRVPNSAKRSQEPHQANATVAGADSKG